MRVIIPNFDLLAWTLVWISVCTFQDIIFVRALIKVTGVSSIFLFTSPRVRSHATCTRPCPFSCATWRRSSPRLRLRLCVRGNTGMLSFLTVFRIRYILIRIRILGSVLFCYGSGSSDPFPMIADPDPEPK